MHPRATTQAVALDHTSLHRWAPALPHVPQLRASPPCRGGFWRCHVSHGFGLCLPERRAPALPRVSQLQTLPPCRGGLRRCHVVRPRLPERRAPVLPHTSRPQRVVDHRNKRRPSCPRHAAGLACVQSTVACYRGACKACGQTATTRFNSATQAQLTTPGHCYSGDMI
jgi:hypothetical protein